MPPSFSNHTIKLQKKEENLRNIQNILILQESAPEKKEDKPPIELILPRITLKTTLRLNKKNSAKEIPQNLLKLEQKNTTLKTSPQNVLNLKEQATQKNQVLPIEKNTPINPLTYVNQANKTEPEDSLNYPIQTPAKQHKEKKASLPSFSEKNIFLDFSRKPRPWHKKIFSFWQNEIKSIQQYFANGTQKNILFFFLKAKIFLRPNFAYGWERKITYFVLASIIISCTVSGLAFAQKINFTKKRVLGKAIDIFSHFKEGGQALLDKNFEIAEGEFRTASYKLLDLQSEIKQINTTLVSLAKISPKDNQLKTGMAAVNLAQESAQAAEISAQLLSRFYNLDQVYGEDQFKLDQNLSLTEAIDKSRENLSQIAFHLSNINTDLESFDANSLPIDQETIKMVQDKSEKMQNSIEDILKYSDAILEFLGHNQKKRYLILFQNNNEIRATGGFIGTYAIMDFDQGKVENLKIDGIYNPAGQLNLKIKPPEPIRFFNKVWNIQDSNWFPDFPTSAQKTAWFLQKTGGPSVDGVIALTPNVIADFLRLSGPIDMPEYQTTVNADNFVSQTQREVELEYDQELNQPKKFLADLAPKLLNQIFSTDKISKMDALGVINENLKKKNIQLFSFDDQMQKFFSEQNWSGEMKQAQKDYLAVINSNISGGKTDNFIQESIDLKVAIQSDGKVINYLKITRKHTGNNEWPSTKNIVYQRIYTPQGSDLLESRNFDKIEIPPVSLEEDGYEEDPLLAEIEESKKVTSNNTDIFEEEGKTVFANWVAVNPGEEKTVLYKYELPFKISPENIDSYSLFAQKQAGSFGSKINLSIYLPRGIKAVWENQTKDNEEKFGLVEFKDDLEEDKYFAVTLEKM